MTLPKIPPPLVSVVMPAFNAAQTIEVAARSVLAQSYANLELIVCDDASTDDTAERIRSYRDPRVSLVTNPENVGEGRARDRAIAASRGDWIAVLDADDAWAPQRLQRLMEHAPPSMNRMVFDDIMVCHHSPHGMVPWRAIRGTRAFGSSGTGPRDIRFEDFIREDRLLIKPLIPREFIAANRLEHSTRRFAADSEFFIRLGMLGLGFRYLPEPLYLYRVMPGSATAIASSKHLMRECIEDLARTEGLSDNVRDAIQFKIRSLQRNEGMYALVASLRRADLRGMLREIVKHPDMLLHFPGRALRHLAYQAHRLKSSGVRR
jgi:succinoglycan biosynthesis protein ExoO